MFDRDIRSAYTLLVAGIEVLSRAYGSPPSTWADWEDSSQWDALFEATGLTPDQSAVMRDKLLQNRQLRLKATFRSYGASRLPGSFWDKPWKGWSYGINASQGTVASPTLGPLVDDWLAWLRSPGILSPKTRRPYASSTVARYEASWGRLLAVLPRGRKGTLSDLTRGFVADYRVSRKRDGCEGATINRDLCALSAFFTWLEEEREMDVTRPHFRHEEEAGGRERWLSADELRRLLEAAPTPWRPFFALLAYTGLRLGEAIGKDGTPALRWGDVRLAERRLTVQARTRRLKTSGSARDVPIPDALAVYLAGHRVATPGGPADAVFPYPFTYGQAQKVFGKACEAAELHDVRVHDLRHTFAGHWVMAGLPLARLQKILGHRTPAMTMRYARHAPEAYFAEDAARLAASLNGMVDKDAEAVRRAVMRADSA